MPVRLATGLLFLFAGCGGGSEPQATTEPVEAPPAEADKPHVVLITLDTTRADRLGAYGYADAHTETLDALAAEGRRYDRAYSPVPLTIPAHASIFTGLYPAHHGVRDNGHGVLRRELVTLPEVMREGGYRTGASVSAYVTNRIWGFDQGFDDYYDELPPGSDTTLWRAERPAAAVVDDALAWKTRQPDDAPLFLWIHLYDPHFPFAPPLRYAESVEGRPYDGELAYVDDEIARLVEAFVGEPTLFVVAADHGEGLGDHGELTHGLYVYEGTQRVPFFISGPGVEVEVVDEVVSLVDLAPTVLDLVGLEAPTGIDGRVVPAGASRPVHMETYQLRDRFGLAPHIGVVDGDAKLISVPRVEVYDVVSDRGELANLAEGAPGEVERLRGLLDGFGFEDPGLTRGGSAAPTDPEVMLQLARLGYVEGSVVFEEGAVLPDAKDYEDFLLRSQEALLLRMQGNTGDAIAKLVTIAADYPDMVEIHTRLASALSSIGKRDEAGKVAREAYERHPHHAGLKGFVAQSMARDGEYREASTLFREVAEEMPWAPHVRLLAVVTLMSAPDGREEAVELGLSYLDTHPDDYGVAGLLGAEFIRRGEIDRAKAYLEVGILADRPARDVAFFLGITAETQGDFDGAKTLYLRELELFPTNDPAARALLVLVATQEDWKAVVETADGLLAHRPDPVVYQAKAQALFNLEDFAASREALEKGLALAPESSALLLLDANLIAKEGDLERSAARFEEARAAKAKEDAALAKEADPVVPEP